jgi:hypothetical protein
MKMFPRRKRNFDLSGVKERFRQTESTHGINWDTELKQVEASVAAHVDSWKLESGWEEEDADFEPVDENLNQRSPKGQPELAYSERQNAKISHLRQPETPYPGLQMRPDFNEQHKKLTVYIEKELLVTIERLKKGRYIPSYSWLINQAIKHYLAKK